MTGLAIEGSGKMPSYRLFLNSNQVKPPPPQRHQHQVDLVGLSGRSGPSAQQLAIKDRGCGCAFAAEEAVLEIRLRLRPALHLIAKVQ